MPNIDGTPHHLSDTETPKRGRRVSKSAVATVRKHKVENVNRNQLAQVLDAYAAEGREIVVMNISRDIGGTYEIVSFKEEPAL